ncbi:MAG: cupin domain-containing protein [Proteobacteria bacterium]|nr:cupin domain-containing protein [Pseudomonadota bacterium]
MSSKGIQRPDESTEYWFEEGCHILELANSADDPDVSIARARVGPGQTTRWHTLSSTTERYVILSGEGIVEIGKDLRESVTTGVVVRIPADIPQRIHNCGTEDLVFLAICSPRFTPECYSAMEPDAD